VTDQGGLVCFPAAVFKVGENDRVRKEEYII